MPVIDTKLSRLNRVIGHELSLEELGEVLFRFGMEIDSAKEMDSGDYLLKIEVTPDRPDMLSVWGLARALRKYLGFETGIERYEVKNGDYNIFVDASVSKVRPYIAATVVRNIRLTEEDLEDLIYAQEKLHETFCRGRKKASIGLYPFQKLRWPLHYRAESPNMIRFRPLGFDIEMSGIEILRKHPTGQQYAHLLESAEKYPVFIDDAGHVLSLPPIINSEDYGKITIDDTDILLEVTGTHKHTVELVVNMFTAILSDIGGELYNVKIHYPNHIETSPYLYPRIWKLNVSYVKRILGVNFTREEIKDLLGRMGLEVTGNEKDNYIKVAVPAYRADIWHQIDIVDDIARSYGFDNFTPELTPVFTIGGSLDRTQIIDYIREIMIGLGFTEVFTFALTSKDDQFIKMNLDVSTSVVEISGAREEKINIVRNWLLPELLKALSYSKERKYPINIFEVSDVVELSNNSDTGAINKTKIAALSAHKDASFTEIRSVLEYLLNSLGVQKFSVKRIVHNSFIRGRVAGVFLNNDQVGFVGELHPRVITNWGLAVPICAMELDLDKIMQWAYKPVEVA